MWYGWSHHWVMAFQGVQGSVGDFHIFRKLFRSLFKCDFVYWNCDLSSISFHSNNIPCGCNCRNISCRLRQHFISWIIVEMWSYTTMFPQLVPVCRWTRLNRLSHKNGLVEITLVAGFCVPWIQGSVARSAESFCKMHQKNKYGYDGVDIFVVLNNGGCSIVVSTPRRDSTTLNCSRYEVFCTCKY